MFLMIMLGLDVIVLLMLFGVMSKLDELNREVRALRREQANIPATAKSPPPAG